MTDCEKCKDLNVVFPIKVPSELKQAIRIAKQNIEDNTIGLLETGPWCRPFAEISESGEWEDILSYVFKCNFCGKRFRLSAETYHGAGGKWQPV